MITELNERSQMILRAVVDAYMATGEPVGSRTLTETLGLNLSSATIRNIMAGLEREGLLHAPHTSAGRMPTQSGLRLYVDGLMEIGDLTIEERSQIEKRCRAAGHSMTQVLEQASFMLSGLSSAVGLVVAPKTNKPIRQIQFVQLDSRNVLIIIVTKDGLVENRVMDVGIAVSQSTLTMASNYLNDKLQGRTLAEARADILRDIKDNRAHLDAITSDLVERGLALAPTEDMDGHIIVRGQSRLLEDVRALEDLERARQLLEILEEQETIAKFIESSQSAEGIQIYIGSENRMFEHSGCSMVLSPYKNEENRIVGAIGVIGPLRLNYSRIIPIVDYTSKVMGKIIGS